MDLNHLHIAVADLSKSRAFYEKCFGFHDKETHGSMLFMENADGFMLALDPSVRPEKLPSWFHFGFRVETPTQVKALYEVVKSCDAHIAKPLVEFDDIVAFQCDDVDGYRVEVYWESDRT